VPKALLWDMKGVDAGSWRQPALKSIEAVMVRSIGRDRGEIVSTIPKRHDQHMFWRVGRRPCLPFCSASAACYGT